MGMRNGQRQNERCCARLVFGRQEQKSKCKMRNFPFEKIEQASRIFLQNVEIEQIEMEEKKIRHKSIHEHSAMRRQWRSQLSFYDMPVGYKYGNIQKKKLFNSFRHRFDRAYGRDVIHVYKVLNHLAYQLCLKKIR